MDIFLFFSIILIASVLQTSTGFGFSILATPFLLLLFEPAEAIQINLVLSLVISSALIMKIRKDVDFQMLKRFVISSAAGLPVGMMIFLWADIQQLKLAVGLVILALTALIMYRFQLKQNKNRDWMVGGVSGSLTTSIGMPGPPLLLYFSGAAARKETVRSTTLAFYLFIYSASLVVQVLVAGTSTTVWLSSGTALPVVLVGMYLGQLLFHRIDQAVFRLFTLVLLLFTGSYLLFESFFR